MACVVVVRRHKRSLQILDFRDFCQRMSLRKDNVLVFHSEKNHYKFKTFRLAFNKMYNSKYNNILWIFLPEILSDELH